MLSLLRMRLILRQQYVGYNILITNLGNWHYYKLTIMFAMRILQRTLGIVPREPESILRNRIILQKRQRLGLEKAQGLPSEQSLLQLPLSELAKMEGKQKFGTFVSRCNNEFNKDLKFLADVNISRALEINSEGIPFTVKDHIKVDGMVETCGYSHNISESYENAQVVNLLIQSGCVPFAHTNVPQGLLNIETGNNVWGKATNPYKQYFTTGGSSGGDGAAVATRCSAFGVVSDTAGSAKIPAAYCGVVGFKPTGSKRLSVKGRVGVTGKEGPSIKDLDTSIGFITRSVNDLSWLCERTLGKTIEYNPYVSGVWNSQKFEEAKKKKLKFGYMIEDHEMKAVPAVKNSILESIDMLRQNGHQVVPFEFPQLHKFRDFIFRVMVNTSFLSAMNYKLQGESAHDQCKFVFQRAEQGRIGAMIRKMISTSEAERHIYDLFTTGGSTMDLLKLIAEKDIVKQRFLKSWAQSGIDVLITPVTPFTAPLQKSDGQLMTQLTFSGFPNVLEMPSGTIPVRMVRKQETEYDDLSFFGRKISSSIQRSEGLPVGIQLTSAFMDDETCIAAMWQLQKLLPKLPAPPAHW